VILLFQKIKQMEANPDSQSKSSLNMKEVATTIAMQLLKHTHREVVVVQSKQIIEFARKWGAVISPEQESNAINDLKAFFPEPASWPTIKVVPEVGTLSTSTAAAPRGRPKQDSDPEPKDNNKRKAADFAELKVPDGQAIPNCPAAMKSGDRDICGKPCRRVLDGHDPSIPECAQFKCNHLYCGTHITKAAGMNTGAARKRLEKTPDESAAPVTVKENGKTTTLDTGVLDELKPATSAGAGKAALSKIFDRVNQRKKDASASVDNDNNK
jgi:hypothetical protein